MSKKPFWPTPSLANLRRSTTVTAFGLTPSEGLVVGAGLSLLGLGAVLWYFGKPSAGAPATQQTLLSSDSSVPTTLPAGSMFTATVSMVPTTSLSSLQIPTPGATQQDVVDALKQLGLTVSVKSQQGSTFSIQGQNASNAPYAPPVSAMTIATASGSFDVTISNLAQAIS